jgi:hypothetical protein
MAYHYCTVQIYSFLFSFFRVLCFYSHLLCVCFRVQIGFGVSDEKKYLCVEHKHEKNEEMKLCFPVIIREEIYNYVPLQFDFLLCAARWSFLVSPLGPPNKTISQKTIQSNNATFKTNKREPPQQHTRTTDGESLEWHSNLCQKVSEQSHCILHFLFLMAIIKIIIVQLYIKYNAFV